MSTSNLSQAEKARRFDELKSLIIGDFESKCLNTPQQVWELLNIVSLHLGDTALFGICDLAKLGNQNAMAYFDELCQVARISKESKLDAADLSHSNEVIAPAP